MTTLKDLKLGQPSKVRVAGIEHEAVLYDEGRNPKVVCRDWRAGLAQLPIQRRVGPRRRV